MNQAMELLTLRLETGQAVALVTGLLTRLGLQVVPSFDLLAARDGPAQCGSPHHGTNQCNCQLVVLLVYGQSGSPATLLIHGQDGEAHLSLVENPRLSFESDLAGVILRVLRANLKSI